MANRSDHYRYAGDRSYSVFKTIIKLKLMKKVIFISILCLLYNIVLSQNVGIGANNPTKGKLVVRGTSGAVSAIFGDTTSGVAIENNYPGIAFNSFFNGFRQPIVNGFGGLTGMDPASGNFHIYTSATAGTAGNYLPISLRMLINKDGNVGLQGNSDPKAPLAFANSIGNKISLWGSDESVQYGLGIQGSLMQLYSASAGSDIAFGYGSSTNFKENVRIKGNGNVGIGASDPAKGKLVVRGSVGAVPAIFGDTTSGIAIENNHPGIGYNSYYNNGRIAMAKGYGGLTGMNPDNGDFHIYTSDTSAEKDNWLATSLRLLINKKGNIGVQGNSEPIAPLSFAHTVGNKISLWGGYDSSHYGLGIQGSLMQLYSANTSSDIAFGSGSSTNFTENMRIKGNGNVGIGTDVPTYPVTLKKEGNGFVQKGTSVEIGTATTGNAGILKTLTNNPLYLAVGNNPNPQLAISLSGRIGINTTTPSCKFDIRHNTFDMFQLYNTSPLAAGENIDMYFRTGSQYTAGIHSIGTSATTARFGISTGSSLSERLSILHDGKVGIGTTNPGGKLEVSGKTILNPNAGEDVAVVVNGVIQLGNAAFVLTANVSNLNANGYSITIDNPYSNGKPGAIVMVTSRMYKPIPFSVDYDSDTNKWFIHTTSDYKVKGLTTVGYTTCQDNCASFTNPILGDHSFSNGDSFNILIIY